MNILHTARRTPNTAFHHDAFGNVTNATDTAGNSWQFTYSANSTLTNEVFTSPRLLCGSACQTNALARLVDAYSLAYTNDAGYNYGCTLATPGGAILRRTVTRDPYWRGLTLNCSTSFNGVSVESFDYAFDAHGRPVARNGDSFAYDTLGKVVAANIGTNAFEHSYDPEWNHSEIWQTNGLHDS